MNHQDPNYADMTGVPYQYQIAQSLRNIDRRAQRQQNSNNAAAIAYLLSIAPKWVRIAVFLIIGVPVALIVLGIVF